VSTFILTTPYYTATAISCSLEPEPPWKTRSRGSEPGPKPEEVPYFSMIASCAYFRISGRSLTLPGL
jgi:hypothetical protein